MVAMMQVFIVVFVAILVVFQGSKHCQGYMLLACYWGPLGSRLQNSHIFLQTQVTTSALFERSGASVETARKAGEIC